MKAKEWIHKILKHPQWGHIDIEWDAVDELHNLIHEQDWIPIGKDFPKPEEGQDVQITAQRLTVNYMDFDETTGECKSIQQWSDPFVDIAIFSDGQYWDVHHGCPYWSEENRGKILAWKPLSTPYKGAEKNVA